MNNTTLQPYLFFNGNCREAMEFYRSVFGGELYVQTYGEADSNCPEEQKDLVIHASLRSGAITLFASDGTDTPREESKRISLSVNGSDEEQLRDIFEKLSTGGSVPHPLRKEFWGDIFGDLVDPYGIRWMVNISAKKE